MQNIGGAVADFAIVVVGLIVLSLFAEFVDFIWKKLHRRGPTYSDKYLDVAEPGAVINYFEKHNR